MCVKGWRIISPRKKVHESAFVLWARDVRVSDFSVGNLIDSRAVAALKFITVNTVSISLLPFTRKTK